jgi:hypothetical protein
VADGSLVAVGGVACAAAAAFGWGALRAQRAHARWCASRTRADGVVSRVVRRRRNGGLAEDAAGLPTDPASTRTPVVRFRARDGVEYEIDAPEAPARIGATVALAYDPALPSDGRAIERTPKIGCAALLLLAGALLVAIGANRG